MTIAFEDEWVTLHEGRCEEILPTLESGTFDLVLTDPPYGIPSGVSVTGNFGSDRDNIRRIEVEAEWNAEIDWMPWLFNAERLLRPGGYLVTFFDRRQWQVQGKIQKLGLLPFHKFYLVKPAPPPSPRNMFSSGVEEALIFTKPGGATRRTWNGGGATPNYWRGHTGARTSKRDHPAEKPLEPMALLVRCLTDEGDLVLDPFAGTSTTLEAARMLGRRSVGIEMHGPHVEASVRRLNQHFTYIPETTP